MICDHCCEERENPNKTDLERVVEAVRELHYCLDLIPEGLKREENKRKLAFMALDLTEACLKKEKT